MHFGSDCISRPSIPASQRGHQDKLITASAERDTASRSVEVHSSPGRALRLISSIRWDEVILWQGTPFFGALFSIGSVTGNKAAALALLLAASCCLVAHVFALNDWSEAEGDLREPSRAAGIFVAKRDVRRTEMGHLCAALMVLGLLPLLPFGIRTVSIGLQIVILSVLYSAPGLHFKGVPVLNSAIHLAGGLLHFLLAYSLFRPIDARGLAIGAFFALIFAAGHLTHEARDWDSDHRNAINTNAVRFGRRRSFGAGVALFAIADGLLLILALNATVPRPLAAVAVLYFLQLIWSVQTLRAGLTFTSIRRMQLRYRILYAALGALMIMTMLPSLSP